ncbi:MAG TPA: GntR family transcriptional regulator [Xanthobacteraceae bacterium]|nr:GntR family transcriptional regulator [Xanthobacteraceae bacterium]
MINYSSLTKAVPISKRLGNPLHQQVFLVLRDRILSRRYDVGEMLPSEDDLARMFNVSRTTVRNAMASLSVTGLVEKRQGVGTFVREAGTATPIRTSMSDMVTHIHEIGRSTSVQVVEFGYEKPPKHVQELFHAKDDDIFQRAIRVRRLKRRPILYVTSYIPEMIGRHFDASEMERKPVFDLLEGSGIRLKTGEQWVTATLAEPIIASRLAIEVGSPLLQIERIHFNQKTEPVEYLEILAVPRFFELRMRLGTEAE